MADRHSGTLIGVGGVAVVAGGVLISIAAAEVSGTPRALSSNGWFDLGLAVVILGVVLAVIGGVLHFRREVEGSSAPEVVDTPAAGALPAAGINPAEWIATCDESGEFPSKALIFNLRHRFQNMGARQIFGLLRCIVTDPDGIRTEATGLPSFYQYVDPIFPGAPPVRPGLYRFDWRGQMSNGEWVDITSGERLVQPPPKTGLEVVIDREIPSAFPGAGLILQIEYHVTNHDAMEHTLFKSMESVSPFHLGPHGTTDNPEQGPLWQAFGVISEQRRGDELPKSVRSGETVRGVQVVEFDWDPVHPLPDYTLIISDGTNKAKVRPRTISESEPTAS